jgi:uncharacterized protein (TIGR03083 family)
MKEFLGDIASDSEAFAATIRPDTLDRRVPDCPDWVLRDLVWHLGRVQQGWAAIVRSGVDEPPDFSQERKSGPSDARELADWMRASTEDLLDALRAAPSDARAWTWWKEPRTAGAIGRHQVQEAAVHRWDAQAAVGTPDPLPAALADDGVEEFLEISRQLRKPAPILFEATDTGRTFTLSDAKPVVTVSAPSADLVLLLYRRLAPDDVRVEGDRGALDEFLAPIE